jgi:hypothetical protein
LPPLPHSVDEYPEFFDARRIAIADRIRLKLATNSTDVAEALEDKPQTTVSGIDEDLSEADLDS